MTWSLLVVVVVAFVVSVLAPFAFRPLLVKWGIVDVPNERSSHVEPTLRAGGLAPLCGGLVGLIVAAALSPENGATFIVVGVTTLMFAVLGFIDDICDLPAALRLGIQLLIAVGASVVALQVTAPAIIAVVVGAGVLLIVGYVNTANFMDGINGLSGMHGLLVGLAFACTGVVVGENWLSYVGAVIATSFAAFLPWNLHRSRFFLGDVGSYALGGAISVTSVLALAEGISPLLILAPLAVYVADTATTMARRMVRGERVTSPHRSHVYQRLTDTGLSHVAAAGVVTSFAAANVTIALVVTLVRATPWIGVVAIAAVCLIYLFVPRWREMRSASKRSGPASAPDVPTIGASPTHSPRRWAVLGASGFVGSAVETELRERGYDTVQVRAPRLLQTTPVDADVDSLLEEAAAHPAMHELARRLRGVDVVVNAAGLAAPDASADGALYGANALLPAVIAKAAYIAGVKRLVHLSSAAVQGRTSRLDSSRDVAPFSPYSRSKALGEMALLAIGARERTVEIVILRATSVQGPGRHTTEQFIRLAHSRLSSVAAPGTSPSAVSSITRLVRTTIDLGTAVAEIPGIVLQPWEGLSTRRVLEAAAPGFPPRVLPRWICRLAVSTGFLVGRFVPRLTGLSRRAEVMWFGQAQTAGWNQPDTVTESEDLLRILGGGSRL